MYEATVSKRGSVKIPAPIRRELGLFPGQPVFASLDKDMRVISLKFEGVNDEVYVCVPEVTNAIDY